MCDCITLGLSMMSASPVTFCDWMTLGTSAAMASTKLDYKAASKQVEEKREEEAVKILPSDSRVGEGYIAVKIAL